MSESESPLKRRNDEIYRRWRAGENHLDLAREYERSGLETMLWRRYVEEFGLERPERGKSNAEWNKEMAPRNEDIIRSRAEGKTYRELAKKYKISNERVRQIWAKEMRKRMKNERLDLVPK